MPTPHYGQPRYRLIANELRKRIESGVITPGGLLPAETALTAEFRASRGTIRRAIAVLRDDGLATTAHGRGTFANAPSSEARGAKPQASSLSRREVHADAELAALFEVQVGVALIELRSVTIQGGKVETVTRTYRLR
ncbi:GntR family transcriptional regulator [Micromonospora chalcea]|uniref:GntR family transcriptional regulator n=1 Tax=Micromonospora chalcea TaxID=1874 RepID=UPI0038063C4E